MTTTRVLAEAIAASDRRPAFLAGNGISFYGDHGDDGARRERGQPRRRPAHLGHPRVAGRGRARRRPPAPGVCVLRTAPVMDRRSEPLKQLRLLFRAGLGGRLGDGRQRMAMISLRDWVGATVHLAEHADASGPFNLCCPQTPTNAEFTEALAGQLHRPSFATVPRFALKVGAGRMAPELLGSLNVVPAALVASGYEFRDPDVDAVLRAGLSQSA